MLQHIYTTQSTFGRASVCFLFCATLLVHLLDPQCCLALYLVHSPGVKVVVSPSRVPQGSTATLICEWETGVTPDSSAIHWEKDGASIPKDNPRFNVRSQTTGSVLQIASLKAKDAGLYTCVRSLGAGNLTVRDSKTLTVIVPPNIHQTIGDVALEGDPATLECVCDNCLFVHWEHRKFSLEIDPRFSNEGTGAVLSISSVRVSDRGRYTCTAYNERFQTRQKVFLTVKRKPLITIRPKTTVIPPGDTAILLCQIASFPPATLHWFFNTVLIDYDRRHNLFVHKEGNLEIRNANLSDHGYYRCMAKNSFGAVSSEARLIVKVPRKEVNVGQQTVIYNHTVILTCPSDDTDGVYKVRWLFGRHRVDTLLMPRYKQLINGSLRISGVQYDDELEYLMCAMTNINGEDHHNGESTLMTIARIQLVVKEPIGVAGHIAVEQTAEFTVCVKWSTAISLLTLETISQLKVAVRSIAGAVYRTAVVDVSRRNVSLTNMPEDNSYKVQIDCVMADRSYVPGKEIIVPLTKLRKTARRLAEVITTETPTKNGTPHRTSSVKESATQSSIIGLRFLRQESNNEENNSNSLVIGLAVALSVATTAIVVLLVYIFLLHKQNDKKEQGDDANKHTDD